MSELKKLYEKGSLIFANNINNSNLDGIFGLKDNKIKPFLFCERETADEIFDLLKENKELMLKHEIKKEEL